jgi:hypothetical protein
MDWIDGRQEQQAPEKARAVSCSFVHWLCPLAGLGMRHTL